MSKPDSFISTSEDETIAWARRWAENLQPGDVVALKGDLGAGKTHFVKGVAEALEIEKSNVHSPTFSLIHEYGGSPPLYHFDCYRMGSVREALEIGIEEYFYGEGVCIIEWPDRILSILPEGTIWITLEATGKNKRRIIVEP